MGLANALEESDKSAGSPGDPSVSSSLEHLIAGSQGVITKGVDLALLETQELLSRFIERTALAGVAILLAAGAWFAAAGALVLLVTPSADPVLQLVVFGLFNAAGTLGLVRIVQRYSLPIAAAYENAGSEIPAAEPSPSEARS